jgi:multiple antibiotic resistance protein
MTLPWQLIVGFFLTLVALYSPLAAAAAYGPIIGNFGADDRKRIALRLFLYVSVLLVLVVAIGELLLEIVGVSTTALGAAGGLALLYSGIPMMRGIEQIPPEDPTHIGERLAADSDSSWRSVVVVPLAFPLSVGGSTVAATLATVTRAETGADLVVLALVTVGFGLIICLTALVGGGLPARLSPTGRNVLARLGGLLLTTIGLSVFVTNVTRIAVEAGANLGSR